MPRKTKTNRKSQAGAEQSEEDEQDQEEEMEFPQPKDLPSVKGPCERLFHPEELKQLIPIFREGSRVSDWIETIDHYQTLYMWSPNSTLLYATCRLGGAAYQWYLGVRQIILSWTNLKDGLRLAFPDQDDEADIHRKLAKCVKDPKESYDNYVFRMNAIGQKGKLSSSAIIKYVISGLSYDPLYSSVSTRQFETIYSLLEHVRYCEANQEMFKPRNNIWKSGGLKTGTSGPTMKKQQEESKVRSSGGENRTIMKKTDSNECYNCHGSGHISVNCPQPQRRPRCPLCNKVGHDEERCFKRNQGEGEPAATSKPTTNTSTTAYPIVSGGNFLEVDENSLLCVNTVIENTTQTIEALVDSGCPIQKAKKMYNLKRLKNERPPK